MQSGCGLPYVGVPYVGVPYVGVPYVGVPMGPVSARAGEYLGWDLKFMCPKFFYLF